ncbi:MULTISPECIES: TIGR04540 family protein [Lactobacillales]|uniref:TIGR04540 family protein n=1 Tax=Lactobacillales TaxID=186826 RepID=UPI00066006A5|nr:MULTISPECIES: TIGR04540 family protein [Lactobacillales]MEC1386936.1 TIGR04540 family protein [Aerococcus viridans]
MKVKKFYRTQRDVATALNEIIDAYWIDKLTDEELEENIIIIYKNNQRKIIKNDDFTTILKQQCGKNRLTVVTNIITN